MKNDKLIFPHFNKPNTRDEAFSLAKQYTGKFWSDFSAPKSAPSSTWNLLGGQAFLGKRVKGPEWYISQGLCWLCGRGVLTPTELITALGRNPKSGPDSKLEEKVTGAMRSSPPVSLIENIHSYGIEVYPTAKYKKHERFYDSDLPDRSD